jgi:predicted dehydrogenase
MLALHRAGIIAFLIAMSSSALSAEIRTGIIGTDTSHATAFTEAMNKTNNNACVPGAKVVAAYKGGSADIPSSASRGEEYAAKLRDSFGVRFYNTIEELCKNVDAVLLESVDGRPHLEQARPVIKAGKILFVDKPMAGSLKDVIEIFRLANEAKVPVFSSSSLRFGADTRKVQNGSIGKVAYAETYGPCEIEPHHPELFWYGVHGVESLFAVMGVGCVSVTRTNTPDGAIEVRGEWPGGRVGVFREAKDRKFHGSARGEKGEAPIGSFDGYGPLVAEIVKFFKTRVPPVDERETIEIFAFMEASEQSKSQGGKPIRIDEVIKSAR